MGKIITNAEKVTLQFNDIQEKRSFIIFMINSMPDDLELLEKLKTVLNLQDLHKDSLEISFNAAMTKDGLGSFYDTSKHKMFLNFGTNPLRNIFWQIIGVNKPHHREGNSGVKTSLGDVPSELEFTLQSPPKVELNFADASESVHKLDTLSNSSMAPQVRSSVYTTNYFSQDSLRQFANEERDTRDTKNNKPPLHKPVDDLPSSSLHRQRLGLKIQTLLDDGKGTEFHKKTKPNKRHHSQ